MSTALHRRILAFDYGDQERTDLMMKVWAVTPFVVNVRTGSINSETEREITEWCRENFGPDAWPIHGKPGRWQRGSATVYGETFMGFDTAETLAIFMGRFGHLVIEDEAPPPVSNVVGVANPAVSASVSSGRESVGREPDQFVSAHLSPAPTVRLGAGAPSSQDHSRLDYFGDLVAKARVAADKATRKFPQPNYVTLKIAEEAGEVVRGAVHYAEGRMPWKEVEGEIVQLLAMLIRFVTEGDEINGIRPPALATTEGSKNG